MSQSELVSKDPIFSVWREIWNSRSDAFGLFLSFILEWNESHLVSTDHTEKGSIYQNWECGARCRSLCLVWWVTRKVWIMSLRGTQAREVRLQHRQTERTMSWVLSSSVRWVSTMSNSLFTSGSISLLSTRCSHPVKKGKGF